MNAMVADTLSHFQSYFRSRFSSQIPYLDHLMTYVFHSMGKHIRPKVMACLSMDRGYDSNDKRFLQLATIVELIHTGTLLHDDVIDESLLRRGQPAVHKIFGNKASILLGDYCFTQAYMVAQELDPKESAIILPKLAATAQHLVEGELLQMQGKNTMISMEDYHKIIHLKTGCLFQLACESLAILSKQIEIEESWLLTFGRTLGFYYQLLDDYQDYFQSSKVLKKEPGQDFRERKITFPILLAIDAGFLSVSDFFEPQLSFEDLKEPLKKIQPLCYDYVYCRYHECSELLNHYECPLTEGILLETLSKIKHSDKVCAL